MPKFQFAGMSFTAPDAYVDCTVYAVASTDSEGPFQRNMTVVTEPLAGRDLNQLLRSAEQQLLQLRQPTLRFGAKGRLRISGRDAVSIEYATDELLPTGPIRLVRRLIYVPIDERVLAITFTASESDFAAYAAELDAIVASLQV